MTRLIRAEVQKIRTTKGPWVILGIQIVLTGLVAFVIYHHGTTGFTFHSGTSTTPTASTTSGFRSTPHLTPHRFHTLLSVPVELCLVLAPLLGILCITSEYQHRTLTATLIATPIRARVLMAKVAATAIASFILGVSGIAIVGGTALFWSASNGASSDLASTFFALAPRLLATIVLLGLFGIAIGVLLKNQIAAVLASIGGTLIVENLLIDLIKHAFDVNLYWLPSPAAQSFGGYVSGTRPQSMATLLPWWGGGLALLGWAVIPIVLGYFFIFRRDVT